MNIINIKDYTNLKKNDCINKKKKIKQSLDGIKFCSYYINDLIYNTMKPTSQHKLKDGTKKYGNYDTMKNIMINNMDKLKHYKQKYSLNNIIDAFTLLYGRPYMYKPVVVKYFIDKYKPKTMIDGYAGWGNRLISCLATDTNYIGVDTNKKLCDTLIKMSNDTKQFFNSKSEVVIINNKAEETDFSIYEYDMVFMCPPYGLLEIYEDMPIYEEAEDFINRSLIPTINKLWDNLNMYCYFIITIPESYIKYIHFSNCLIDKIVYPKHSCKFRYVNNQVNYQDVETIYVFKKTLV